MTKKNVTRTVDIEYWTIDRIINHIQELGLKLTEVSIDTRTEYYYDSDNKIPVLSYLEIETDEEYEKRIKEEQAFRLSAVNREKQEYERLKKKYG